jgi:hypothetical protein
MPKSIREKPVTLPPGRARLTINPAAIGSTTSVNTIGKLRLSFNKGPTTDPP